MLEVTNKNNRPFLWRLFIVLASVSVCCFAFYWQYTGVDCKILNRENFDILGVKEYYLFFCHRILVLFLFFNLTNIIYQLYCNFHFWKVSFFLFFDSLCTIVLIILTFMVIPWFIFANFFDLYVHLLHFQIVLPLGLDATVMDLINCQMDPKDLPKNVIPSMGEHSIVSGTTEKGQNYICVNSKNLLLKAAPNDLAKRGIEMLYASRFGPNEHNCYTSVVSPDTPPKK